MFGKLKDWRRIHTRYDRCAHTFMSAICIAESHIYLNKIFERFPADAIGGANRTLVAKRQISVDVGGQMPVMTDLDGKKKIFRDRSLAREFFKRCEANLGDFVVIQQLAPYQYSLSLRRF